MKKIKKIEKNIEKKSNVKESEHHELKSFLCLVGVVVILFGCFYGITEFINSRPKKKETEVASETIQYKEILVGEILNRKEDVYYVLVEAKNDFYNDLYVAYLETYISENEKSNYYTVNLEDPLNQLYLSDKTSVKGNDISKYTFNTTALIKVKNGKMEKSYVNQTDILSALNKILK